MPKDYKIGMFVGLLLVIGATIRLSVHPSLSARAIIPWAGKAKTEQEIIKQTNFSPNSPDRYPSITGTESKQEEVKVVEGPTYHTVRNGETLSAISFLYYGSETQWQKILDANRNIIKDVKNLKPGMKLVLPE
jgi:nucleoid-associated protein YgaU